MPGPAAVIGIDLGTSSAKALVLDTQGRTLGTGKADYPVVSPQPGWAESDPADWWRSVVSAVREATSAASGVEIVAIGLCGQMHGVVLSDERGSPLRPALLWPDTRAEVELARYRALPGDALYRLANPLGPGMTGPLLCWLAEHETASYHAARWALQPKDWLRLNLTGADDGAATDPSDASATLLYDLPADHWADDVIAALGLRRESFPPIAPSGALAGLLSSRAASEFGLSPGLPVAVGAADTAVSALGTGLLEAGPCQLTLGTGAQLVELSPAAVIDPTMRTHLYRAADGINWYRMAAVQNAGLALDWVRRVLGVSWDELYASAGSGEPGARGVLFLPYLTAERSMWGESETGGHPQGPAQPPAPPVSLWRGGDGGWRGGAYWGMRIEHGRGDLLRAALDGVAFGVRAALETLPGASEGSALRLAGGGSIHPEWRQMIADVLGKELLVVDVADASARGAALLGGIAGGVWADAMATASFAPAVSVVVVPQTEQGRVYDEVYEVWKGLST